jgi:hypothetical protein
MVDLFAPGFLAVLRDVAAGHLAAEDEALAGLDAATREDGPGAAALAQDALAALEAGLRERILEETHKRLREDPAAILRHWNPKPVDRH